MDQGRSILSGRQFELTIMRLAHQVIENYPTWEDACIMGIQESGVQLAESLATEIKRVSKAKHIPLGKLDITFYRDDYRIRDKPLSPSQTTVPGHTLEHKRIVLVDDVLYTGRTVQAAMSAIQDFGRPAQVELLVLVDRRFVRHLPIQADYSGIVVDAINQAYVKVSWAQASADHQVLLYSPEGYSHQNDNV